LFFKENNINQPTHNAKKLWMEQTGVRLKNYPYNKGGDIG
jgi:hypothetical protein